MSIWFMVDASRKFLHTRNIWQRLVSYVDVMTKRWFYSEELSLDNNATFELKHNIKITAITIYLVLHKYISYLCLQFDILITDIKSSSSVKAILSCSGCTAGSAIMKYHEILIEIMGQLLQETPKRIIPVTIETFSQSLASTHSHTSPEMHTQPWVLRCLSLSPREDWRDAVADTGENSVKNTFPHAGGRCRREFASRLVSHTLSGVISGNLFDVGQLNIPGWPHSSH